MYIYRLFCIHQLKRDAFALCALILIFMLNCALILQRQVDKISDPYSPCNHDAADAYILEIPEELNESLVHDTANTPILEIPEEPLSLTQRQPTPACASLAFTTWPCSGLAEAPTRSRRESPKTSRGARGTSRQIILLSRYIFRKTCG